MKEDLYTVLIGGKQWAFFARTQAGKKRQVAKIARRLAEEAVPKKRGK